MSYFIHNSNKISVAISRTKDLNFVTVICFLYTSFFAKVLVFLPALFISYLVSLGSIEYSGLEIAHCSLEAFPMILVAAQMRSPDYVSVCFLPV